MNLLESIFVSKVYKSPKINSSRSLLCNSFESFKEETSFFYIVVKSIYSDSKGDEHNNLIDESCYRSSPSMIYEPTY